MKTANGCENGFESFNFKDKRHRLAISLAKEFTFAYFNLGGGQLAIGGALLKEGDAYLLAYAVALCSPEDNFSKKIAREKISQHLLQKRYLRKRGLLHFADDAASCKPFELLEDAATHYLKRKDVQLPNWAKGCCLVGRLRAGHPGRPGTLPWLLQSVLG